MNINVTFNETDLSKLSIAKRTLLLDILAEMNAVDSDCAIECKSTVVISQKEPSALDITYQPMATKQSVTQALNKPDAVKAEKKVRTLPMADSLVQLIKNNGKPLAVLARELGCDEKYLYYVCDYKKMRPLLIQPLAKALNVPISVINGIIVEG